MIAILSPTMNMKVPTYKNLNSSLPVFNNEAKKIVEILKQYNPYELENKLNLTPKLMDKVFIYYQDFDFSNNLKIGSPAILTFNGLAYKNIDAFDFSNSEMNFANNHIRILSALYGVLKPYDLIQNYRLDFICHFAKNKIDGKNLYEFWGNKVYENIFKEDDTVVSICSVEYQKLIQPFLKPTDKFINCKFIKNKNGKFTTPSTISKMARGKMARFIIKNKIQKIDDLKNFEFDNFTYSQFHSSKDTFTFISN